MFRESEPGLASSFDAFTCLGFPKSISRSSELWIRLEDDPLSREKLESRISGTIQLMLRSEAGDEASREKLKAIG